MTVKVQRYIPFLSDNLFVLYFETLKTNEVMAMTARKIKNVL